MIDPTKLFSLQGRNAVLTGGSAGMGNRMARVLAGAGARTVVVARRGELLDAMAAEVPGIIPLTADLSDACRVRSLASTVLDTLGHVDILVNNAAWIAGGVKAEDETLEQIQRTLAVNLVAPILLGQAFSRGMRERRSGSIINVSSIVASVGIGKFPQAVYAASKGGLEALTREWAAQWSRDGVRVNNLAPGFIATEMTAPVIESEKVQSWIRRESLMARHGMPEDFDGAVLFLASEASAYITGQTLRVDGGWTAH